ncbi:MAG: hypothetical protein ABSF14_23130 [Terriglobia bacterium]|jgi:hypothetical protein
MALGTPTPTLIHQGPGWLYLNVCAPASGKRHIVSADGTPAQPAWSGSQAVTAGQMIVDSNGNIQECTTGGSTGSNAPTSWGSVVGAATADGTSVVWTCTALGPAYLFAGALEGVTDLDIGAKVEETTADQETLPIDAVMTGEVDSIAVTLKESDCGKLQLLVPHGTYSTGTDSALPAGAQAYEEIAFGGLKPVPKYSVLLISKRKDQTAKFVISQIYRAYQKETVKLPFQRGKETTYKVTFQAIADQNRAVGDRGGKVYRQT